MTERDRCGNLIDPTNPWPEHAPWWFDHNAVYTKWRAKHDALVARADLIAAGRGHDDCCLSETNDCNWPACGCDEPQPAPLSKARAT